MLVINSISMVLSAPENLIRVTQLPRPIVLVFDDNGFFRDECIRGLASPDWDLAFWPGQEEPSEFVDQFREKNIFGVVADWHLLIKFPQGLTQEGDPGDRILSKIKRLFPHAEGLLYSREATDSDPNWQMACERLGREGIHWLPAGAITPERVCNALKAQLIARRPTAVAKKTMPFATNIQPDPDLEIDARLKLIVEHLGSKLIDAMIKKLSERLNFQGEARFSFVTPGYSGAFVLRVILGPRRFVLKMLSGNRGF